MDRDTKSGTGNRLVIVIVAAGVVGLLVIFPPCRKNDEILNPATNKVEEISPWRGYVPFFELPRPEGTRGGNFFCGVGCIGDSRRNSYRSRHIRRQVSEVAMTR